MFKRTLDIIVDYEVSTCLKSLDYNNISSCAILRLTYLNQLGVKKYVPETEIAPKANTTCEQAMIVSFRVFNTIPYESKPEETVEIQNKDR